MSAAGLCPSCGYNLTKDEPIERDGFAMDPYAGFTTHNGIRLRGITRAQTVFLHTLAKSGDVAVNSYALLARISERENLNILSVQVGRIRATFKHYKIKPPFENCQGAYRWVSPQ